MKKTVLIFGTIAGLLVSAFMAVTMVIYNNSPEFEGSMVLGFASMIAAFVFIYLGIRNYRDRQLGGTITFARALSTGLLIALLASTFYVVTWAVEYNVFMPDFMEKYTATMLKQEAKKGATPEELAAEAEKMSRYAEMYKSPVLFALLTYTEILPVGIIVSLISALILKKRPHEPEGRMVQA